MHWWKTARPHTQPSARCLCRLSYQAWRTCLHKRARDSRDPSRNRFGFKSCISYLWFSDGIGALHAFVQESEPPHQQSPRHVVIFCVDESWHTYSHKQCSRLWRYIKKPIPVQALHFLFVCFGGHERIACICARTLDHRPAKHRSAAVLWYLTTQCLFAQALLNESIRFEALHFLFVYFCWYASSACILARTPKPAPANPRRLARSSWRFMKYIFAQALSEALGFH